MKAAAHLLPLVVGGLILGGCSKIFGPSQSEDGSAAGDQANMRTPAPHETDTLDGTVLSDFTGDAVAGREIFVQCGACHVIEPGINRIGPSLAGIINRRAGSIPRFNYTTQLAQSGIVWSPAKLNQYLENPQRVVPASRETFAGLPDGQARADVIAFLVEESGR